MIYYWKDIAQDYKGTLLLGNGASIALSGNFSYHNIYEQGVKVGKIDSDIQGLFSKFSANKDFEKLLRRLWAADFINKKFLVDVEEQKKVREPYLKIRRSLINVIKDIHPDHKSLSNSLDVVTDFCSGFGKIFSLNYDLTLPWALDVNNDGAISKIFDDGFTSTQKDNKEIVALGYSPQTQDDKVKVYYLHGNISIVQTKKNHDEKKLISKNDKSSLLKHVTEYWSRNDSQPLFICEGDNSEKISAIYRSRYLTSAFESLKTDSNETLVIYGWSMSNADQHILEAIKQNSSYKRVALSVHESDQEYPAHAKRSLNAAGINDIRFFHSKSAKCWKYS
ncbi:MAG: DUF4917 family protein [Pseudohongiella sp.]|nr:DUF4917 family protein [Pseudohongiella sp.]